MKNVLSFRVLNYEIHKKDTFFELFNEKITIRCLYGKKESREIFLCFFILYSFEEYLLQSRILRAKPSL